MEEKKKRKKCCLVNRTFSWFHKTALKIKLTMVSHFYTYFFPFFTKVTTCTDNVLTWCRWLSFSSLYCLLLLISYFSWYSCSFQNTGIPLLTLPLFWMWQFHKVSWFSCSHYTPLAAAFTHSCSYIQAIVGGVSYTPQLLVWSNSSAISFAIWSTASCWWAAFLSMKNCFEDAFFWTYI